MLNWLEDVVGPDYAPAAFWAILALVVVLVLLGILRLVRRMRAGTYVAGGRNRKARLSIMDAAAVDADRRLVLVRRDDVEHLLLVGGNSDIVVERDIRISGQSRRVTPTVETAEDEPAAVSPARPVSATPRPVVTPAPAPVPSPAPAPIRPAAPPPRPTPPPVAVTPVSRVIAPTRSPIRSKDELDDDLMKELESALDIDDAVPAVTPPKPRPSLDDEMAKLLGELTNQKR